MAALNSASISRLKKTWNMICSKSMKDFEELGEGLERIRYNERLNEFQQSNLSFIPIIGFFSLFLFSLFLNNNLLIKISI